MSYIRKTDYATERVRPKLLTPYISQMSVYLAKRYPQANEEQIDRFVKDTIRQRFSPPEVEAVVHKREGYSAPAIMRLDTFVKDIVADNNLSPSGSCYLPVTTKESFLRRSIQSKIEARNAFKKLYLAAEARGDERESQYYNLNQANSKIFNNAIAGGMKITQFILGSKAGFNAITSIGRMGVKQGYSFIERFVNGNIYFPNTDAVVTYIFNHIRTIPDGFKPLIEQNILHMPSVPDVYHYLETSLVNYTRKIEKDKICGLLSQLNPVELSYVFYVGCFGNLCRYNDALMKQWIASCFVVHPLDPEVYRDIDTKDIKSFKDDVITCVLSTNYQLLGFHPHKNNQYNTLRDAAEFNPDGLKAFIYTCRYFVENFEKLLYILKPIMGIQNTFSKLVFQDNLSRKTVPLSDTDSNIFSVQELVRWRCGEITFNHQAYEMNAIATFLISQCLEHVFGRFSAGIGVEGKDVFRISMKNEFLYPLLMVTSKAKHYIAIATMQEGSLLPTPRKDIKGVGFRSSAYPRIIKDSFEEFATRFNDLVQKGKPIRAMAIMQEIAQLEHTIARSIKNSESVYLQTVAVRVEEDYADPTKSQYFYYEVWKAIFEKDYGEMVIPNKCFKIPLKGGKKLFKNAEFMEGLKQRYPDIHRRMTAFLEANPKKDISYLLIPPFKGSIQPFFLEVMDVRAQVSQVMGAYYNFLDGLGIGNVNTKLNSLVSDYCDPSMELLE